MAEPLLFSLANEAIIAMAGREAFARGLVYAREGRVSGCEFDPESLVVFGRVRGSHSASYATTVQLAGARSEVSVVHRGRCSCPVALDCKHAAALLITARGIPAITSQLGRPDWERSLIRLAAAADPVRTAEEVLLGLEFDIEETPGYRGRQGLISLRVRPVRQGSGQRWVRSGVSWEHLDNLTTGYRSDQRDLLLQIWAGAGTAARFGYPRSSWLPLSGVSPGLWSALARGASSGLALLPPPAAGVVRVEDCAVTVALDARADGDGALALQPVVLREGEPVEAGRIGTLGDPAHGVFWMADTGSGRPALVLAPLARPIPGELRALVSRADEVLVPAADRERFLLEYLPRVRHAAPVVSTDASVTLPEPLVPSLSCQVSFRPEHRVRLDWSFLYRNQTQRLAFPLDEPVTSGSRHYGLRDVAAEARLVAALELPFDRLPVLAGGGATRPAAAALLAGRDAVIFVTEVLPTLRAAGVQVVEEGDRVDYRTVSASPEVRLAVAESSASDWFDLHIQVRVEGERIDFEELFVALATGEEYLITDSGVCLALDRPEFDTLRALITEAQALPDRERPGLRVTPAQASLWDDLLSLGVVVDQSDRWARAVRGLLADPAAEPAPVPATLRAELRPYQQEGYSWLALRYAHNLGGILADDMGLGKTVQTLALLCHARLGSGADEPPFLVVAPTSVIGNWQLEVERFAPALRVVTVPESSARRRRDLADLVAGADLVVTSYTLLRIDIEHFAALPWRGVVLDEAQFVKNHRAKTYASVRRIAAPFKLAITGTPLENNLMDLWSLLSIAAPGLFPHPDRFNQDYRLPIERGNDRAALDRLRRRIRPLVLRRTKESVAADLPPKQEHVVDVVLAPRHQRVYQTHLQRERQKVLGLVDELDKNRFTILRSITLLRQLALDPSLVDEAHATVPASKVDLLVEQLEELTAEGHRALVFSQFTGFLAKIRSRLDLAGISYAYLDGRTRRRDRAIAHFTSGEAPVFLISLKAGGFGLNLTEADYCFVLDPWWNPATEAQAVDRAHRIGQTKPVMVYRMVAKDTIEEKVMELKARKEQLFDSIVGDDALAGVGLTADEIRGLLAG